MNRREGKTETLSNRDTINRKKKKKERETQTDLNIKLDEFNWEGRGGIKGYD